MAKNDVREIRVTWEDKPESDRFFTRPSWQVVKKRNHPNWTIYCREYQDGRLRYGIMHVPSTMIYLEMKTSGGLPTARRLLEALLTNLPDHILDMTEKDDVGPAILDYVKQHSCFGRRPVPWLLDLAGVDAKNL